MGEAIYWPLDRQLRFVWNTLFLAPRFVGFLFCEMSEAVRYFFFDEVIPRIYVRYNHWALVFREVSEAIRYRCFVVDEVILRTSIGASFFSVM